MGAYFTIPELWEWFRQQEGSNQNGGGDTNFVTDSNNDPLVDANGDHIIYE